ncbi:MAG: hypothetical protein LUE92_06825 [Clostridiales bacterium]|nr:hypothetical protein [Clostridiales bacterium]
MATSYAEIPNNFAEAELFTETDPAICADLILKARVCFFYDTCSFRLHSHMPHVESLLEYIANKGGIIVITRCILMELASRSGYLNQEYLTYMKKISNYSVSLLVIYEEDILKLMNLCFSGQAVINDYLCWAVRLLIQNPVTAVREILNRNRTLYERVISGKNISDGRLYTEFFSTVRQEKQSGDSMGEELLAICLYILTHHPMAKDGKFCMVTEDKGALRKFKLILEKVSKWHSGRAMILYSTPKLIQQMYREKILNEKDTIEEMLLALGKGNIAVFGTRPQDLCVKEISLSSRELAEKIASPNEININF